MLFDYYDIEKTIQKMSLQFADFDLGLIIGKGVLNSGEIFCPQIIHFKWDRHFKKTHSTT